ncbi:uncharacterized protein AB675_6022 [Cyphellophora attinorum]|uniref:U4/U6.U5 small nuclear ribonucleoprotein 27kDa protein domain-containing protein n=1 Tax=Cyphellophora attinorum TaxID=1664694 RepID=A0A0N1H5D9_9EURO|nr:uncharacterized protein AB675_6022 [Phialophora attinorum]KPI36947.1 hypothetical protein AB675_6022 [Phialophora attinorum]
MDEPPTKRARRMDSSAMWDREATGSPKSPRPSDSRRDDRGRADTMMIDIATLDATTRSADRDATEKEIGTEIEIETETEIATSNETANEAQIDMTRTVGTTIEIVFETKITNIDQNGRDHVRRQRDEPPKPQPEVKKDPEEKPKVNGDAKMDVDGDDEDAALRRMMGFTSFKTTQNKKVPGNQIYGVRKEKKTVYRQYMNRVGGFNRPLSPGR